MRSGDRPTLLARSLGEADWGSSCEAACQSGPSGPWVPVAEGSRGLWPSAPAAGALGSPARPQRAPGNYQPEHQSPSLQSPPGAVPAAAERGACVAGLPWLGTAAPSCRLAERSPLTASGSERACAGNTPIHRLQSSRKVPVAKSASLLPNPQRTHQRYKSAPCSRRPGAGQLLPCSPVYTGPREWQQS